MRQASTAAIETTRGQRDDLEDAVAGEALLDVVDVASAFDLVQARLFNTRSAPFRVDRYQLAARLGQGGCGVVYRGHDPQLRRDVAVKLIPVGLGRHADPARAQRRLLEEARALASISHPNVVCVYDVGTYSLPAPHRDLRSASARLGVFLVMEQIEGPTLADWLETSRRTTGEIIERFIAVSRGLFAAHRVGVVHGDVKPGNVMIGSDARVRLLDFGLARARTGDVVGTTGRGEHAGRGIGWTRTARVMGTPVYMSPEQHRGAELGPASDQYSLCVSLFVALCGAHPFVGRTVADLHRAKAREQIVWTDRGRHLPRALRGLLQRGLRADPDARFASMNALVTALERVRSSVRRRRRSTMAMVVGAGLAMAGLGGVKWTGHDDGQESCIAQAAAIDGVWNEARANEIGRAFEATGIGYAADTWDRTRRRLHAHARAWRDVRLQACPGGELEQSLGEPAARASRGCLDERLDEIAGLLDELARPDPGVVRRAARASSGLASVSDCQAERRLMQERLTSHDPPERARARATARGVSRARTMATIGRHDAALAQAATALQEALALRRPTLVVRARLTIASATRGLGRYEDAAAELEHAYLEATASADDELAMRAATSLAAVLGSDLQRTDDALRWAGLAGVLAQRLGDDDTYARARLQIVLGNVHQVRGEYADALAVRRRALWGLRHALGPEHPDLAVVLGGLGVAHEALAEYPMALVYLQAALRIAEDALGPDHPDCAPILNNLGKVHESMSAPEHALAAYERALSLWQREPQPEARLVAHALDNLGNVHDTLGALDVALEHHERALALRERALGPDHPDVAASLTNTAITHRSLGSHERELQHHRRALAIFEKAFGPEHPHVAAALNNVGIAHASRGEHAQALHAHQRALDIRREVLGRQHPDAAMSLGNLAGAQEALGQHAAAAQSLQEALGIRLAMLGPDHPDVARTRERLADISTN